MTPAELDKGLALAADAVASAEQALSLARTSLAAVRTLAKMLPDPAGPVTLTLAPQADGSTSIKSSAPVIFAVAPSVPATPKIDPARAWRNGISLGLNVERNKLGAMKYGGADLTQRPWYDYTHALGIDWCRYFIPYNGVDERGAGIGPAPPVARWDGILTGALSAVSAGHRAMIAVTDVLDSGSVSNHWPSILAHVEAVARRILARGFRPEDLVVATANELAQHDNAFWNVRRMELHQALRKVLPPPWVIVHGAAQWNGYKLFDDTWQSPPDDCVLAKFHHYGSEGANWRIIAAQLDAFTAKRKIAVVNGEVADVMAAPYMRQTPANLLRWTANFAAMSEYAGRLRPCLWAVSGDGMDFRLQRDATDATLAPEIEACIRAHAPAVRLAA